MLTRRSWLLATCGLLAGTLPRVAVAAQAIGVPNRSVRAVAAATCGGGFTIQVDGSLGPTQLKVNGRVLDVGSRLHGSANLLDDPRTAPKLGVNIRNALSEVLPKFRDQFAANHKAWSRNFARKIIDWTHKLERSPVRGKRINDSSGRAAALTFAGAIIDPRAKDAGPASLRQLPAQPTAATLASYTAYIERIVAALA